MILLEAVKMIAIDLGSNTIRFIEYDGRKWGNSFEKIVRTAEGLWDTHRIGENAITRILEAIDEAKLKLDFTATILAYTTAAMRLASNAEEVLAKIAQSSGIKFEIIDGKKEAILTLNAVRHRLGVLGIMPSSFLLADIGGGSTELTQYSDSKVETLSLNFGIVTLSETSDTPQKLLDSIDYFKQQIDAQFFSCSTLILTAGTPTTIAAYLLGMDYLTYDPQKVNGFHLTLEACYNVYEALLAMKETDRTRYVGVGRENLIIAGILMVTAIYESLGCDEAIIIDDGLREGIALEYFRQL
ncbi:phosphatase [Sulfuricurvum sp.]|uniref:Ppx/GppA phosphatase family protein n=1 Tax=Sulfuricurvum sp. TaxID=2025608 RepID=UPI0035688F48